MYFDSYINIATNILEFISMIQNENQCGAHTYIIVI